MGPQRRHEPERVPEDGYGVPQQRHRARCHGERVHGVHDGVLSSAAVGRPPVGRRQAVGRPPGAVRPSDRPSVRPTDRPSDRPSHATQRCFPARTPLLLPPPRRADALATRPARPPAPTGQRAPTRRPPPAGHAGAHLSRAHEKQSPDDGGLASPVAVDAEHRHGRGTALGRADHVSPRRPPSPAQTTDRTAGIGGDEGGRPDHDGDHRWLPGPRGHPLDGRVTDPGVSSGPGAVGPRPPRVGRVHRSVAGHDRGRWQEAPSDPLRHGLARHHRPPPPPAVWRVAASLELFHACALIHDDIMDPSETRRCRPTAHRLLTALHHPRQDAETLGTNTAILLGDLALGWSYELLHSPEITADQLAVAWFQLNTLRTETLTGQYLDLVATGSVTAETAAAGRIIRFKTSRYTVEGPLHLGASLAGASPEQTRALTAYALPLGEAFQLRDDLLGMFGDPETTGKSALDDLREGKSTVLTSIAYANASPDQARALRSRLGRADVSPRDAEVVRAIITDTGARDSVECMISERARQAGEALAAAPLLATPLLHELVAKLVDRTA
ncbi:polyprenyl synthetase family protein [Streptomyces sp. 4N509B]|uniref:polyprenyl synthetase family protein n=1 Tax=Streptomyces sp. 4N509B TaxID=3457413 RepID=UPI003FD28DA7